MRYKLLIIICLSILTNITFSPLLYAPWIWTPEGNWTNEKDIVMESPKAQWEKAKELEKKAEYNNAIRSYNALIKAYPTSPFAARSQQMISYCHEKEGQLYEAFKSYQKLIENYPKEIDFEQILQKQYEIGDRFIAGKKRKLFKIPIVPAIDKGIEILKSVIKNAPYSEIAPQAQFKIGVAYKKLGKYTEAIEAFNKVTEEYRNSPWYEESLYQLGICNYKKSRDFSYDKAAGKEAVIIFDKFLKEFPNSKHVSKINSLLENVEGKQAKGLYEIAAFYDKHNHHKAAIMYYRELLDKFPKTTEAKKAIKRIKKLEKDI